jgi:hypothetical protein
MGFRDWVAGSRSPSRELVAAAAEVVEGTIVPSTAGPQRADFAVDPDSGVLYGVPSIDDYVYKRMRISRAEAMRIPAVIRARNLICGGIGQLPFRMYDPAGHPVDWPLFDQPERGIARSITMTNTVEDMFLFGRSWWRVTAVGWHGRPVEVRRLDPESVPVQPSYVTDAYGTSLVWPEMPGLIRIESPNPGILDASPAIRACVALDRATLNYVDGTPPIDYFTPAGDVDPFENDADLDEFLDDWEDVRRKRGTGYVPASVKYNVGGWDPEKLQLTAAREFAITEVARLTGIDAEELSVSTTSRTYANMQDRRRHRSEDVYGPYMTGVEGRLSMDDVTPHGYTGAHDLSGFLRLDDLAAAQADVALVAAGVLLRDEARAKRNLEPLADGAGAVPTPMPVLPAPTPAGSPA